MDWLTDPYAYDFMRRALVAALLVGAVAPMVGVWVVLRRLAYLGDAMSHATLGGVALAYLAGVSITAGAIAAGLAMAALIALLAAHPRLRPDSIIGAAQVTLFAAGLLLLARRDDVAVDLQHLLLGSITTVDASELVLDAALAAAATGALALLFGDLRSATFDPLHARVSGVRTGAVDAALLVVVAVSVVLALQTVGLLLAVALLVVPATAARLWTRTAEAMSALAVAFGVLSATGGLHLAYHLSTPPGATIALCSIALLAASFAATLPRRARRPAGHAAELAPR